ncbi:MAG: flagellar protein FlaG [Steroidobacteraceae bacterium]
MATDAVSSDLNVQAALAAASVSSAASKNSLASTSTSQVVQPHEVQAAVQKLQAHFASRNTPPELSVDYLSGLSVVTVRTADTGEVLYQLPDVDAVRLARLIADGAPDSQGVLDISA